MEKAKTRKIKKWDEIHGEYEVEVSEDMGGGSPEEAAGAGPSISRNPMKGVEDMVEQNDNNLDGVILRYLFRKESRYRDAALKGRSPDGREIQVHSYPCHSGGS